MRRYHWILTLQVFKPHGSMSSLDGHGTVTPAEGGTRQSVFEDAKAYVCEEAGVDPADYSHYALLEITEVRDQLAAMGFDGAEVQDVNPDGDDHDAILVWNTTHLTIKETA